MMRWKLHLIKCPSDKMTIDEMTSWQNDEYMKWQFDKMTNRWNGEFKKWWIDEMTSWQNDK